MKQAKLDGTPGKWKPLLENLCALLRPEEKSKRCREKVDKYVHDIETKTPLEFCLEIQLCEYDELVSSTNNSRPFKLPTGAEYSVCSYFGEAAKVNEAPSRWKTQLDSVCSLQRDENLVAKCKKTVAKYIDDIASQAPVSFCQEINLADDQTKQQLSRHVQGDYSVCKYLVGHAKSVGAPSQWLGPMQSSCAYFDPQERADQCEKTVAKYLDDIQNESPEDFCADRNLVDV